MTDRFSVVGTWAFALGVSIFAALACVNAWIYPDGLDDRNWISRQLTILGGNWAAYLIIALIDEVWLAYELLSWDVIERRKKVRS